MTPPTLASKNLMHGEEPRIAWPRQFAQWERRIISQRTRDALAAKKDQGVRIGRPATLPTAVVERIRAARADGQTLTSIADILTADGVPTAQGGVRWHASTVRAILARATR
jgi:DNA invertase Pin-like site-specific DNA recombinase